MNPSVLPVAAASGTPPVVSRQVRPTAPPEGAATSAPSEVDTRQAVASALNDGGNRIVFGSHSAEFSYDAEADRVVVRIYSANSQPREVIRQIPPQDYLSFVTRFREMLGVLFDNKL
ncbi:MAG: flagellar protein FlaG [Acidobacteriia bacterium]|nr:flagellar protein FlaG [Terriglobia bacterium]